MATIADVVKDASIGVDVSKRMMDNGFWELLTMNTDYNAGNGDSHSKLVNSSISHGWLRVCNS